MLPLRAKDGGVRERSGHTEAAVELCRLAGLPAVGVIGELVKDGAQVVGKTELVGGDVMRRDDCLEFARMWGIKICTIDDMVQWVEKMEGVLPIAGSYY